MGGIIRTDNRQKQRANHSRSRNAVTRSTVITLLALLATLLGLTACGEKEMPTRLLFDELRIPADDVTLHVRIAGNPKAGDVRLNVGMGPGLSSHYMASLEQLAGERFAVVTYDQRGTGRSTESSSGYELHKYVADLESVRQGVGAERVYLLGHCWGGLLLCVYHTWAGWRMYYSR